MNPHRCTHYIYTIARGLPEAVEMLREYGVTCTPAPTRTEGSTVYINGSLGTITEIGVVEGGMIRVDPSRSTFALYGKDYTLNLLIEKLFNAQHQCATCPQFSDYSKRV